MRGMLLHPDTGKPTIESEIKRLEAMKRAPEHVLEQLELARQWAGPMEPRNSLNSWQETMFSSIVTETALTAASEAYLYPLIYGGFGQGAGIPGGYMTPGRTLHLRVSGQCSTAATPGTFTEKIKWTASGDAATAGTTLATSAAVTMVASQTNITWRSEFYLTCRTAGTSGAIIATGIFESAAIPTPFAFTIPASAPAQVTVDTTATRFVTLTHTPSLSTASIAGTQYTLSSLN